MKLLELYCGTKSISKIFESRGHEIYTVDMEKKHNPDLCIDIMYLQPQDIPFEPDVIWASPPCTNFSIACHDHWDIENRKPKQETKYSIRLIAHTIDLILNLNPRFWFLENPKGRLRWILGKPVATVYYGAYGFNVLKPTDLWGFFPEIEFRKVHPDQQFLDWSRWKEDKHIRKASDRSKIPKLLCSEICVACEDALDNSSEAYDKIMKLDVVQT